jgi:osmoprotectant transport system ATP-binding protein
MIRLSDFPESSPPARPAVHDLCLDVPEGKTLVLLGSSDAARPLRLKMINRLIEPTSGTIEVDVKTC